MVVAFEPLLHGLAQSLPGRVAALWDLLMFDLPKQRLDLVQLRAVGRQVVQLQPARLRFFFKPLSTRLARATLAGSCLCLRVEAVRR